MDRPGERPYRATVYLPGHDEGGAWVKVRKVSATTQEGLEAALARWVADGYRVVAYEAPPLPLECDEP